MAAQGLTDKRIAEQLGISAETVTTHWKRIRAKYGASNRGEVIAIALERRAQVLLFEIAQRARVEDELRKLTRALEQAPVGVIIADASREIEYANPAAGRVFNRPIEDLIGSSTDSLSVFEKDARAKLWQDLQSGRQVSFQFQPKSTSRDPKWCGATISPLRDVAGEITHIVGICEDITDRKLAAQALEASQEQIKTILSIAPIILFALDRNGKILASEGQGMHLLGREPGASVGQSVFDLYADNPKLISDVQKALAGIEIQETQVILGRIVQGWVKPTFGEDGEVIGVHGVSVDITDMREKEELLRRTEERYRLVVEQAQDAIVITTRQGDILEINRAACDLFGYSEQELVNMNVVQLCVPEDLVRLPIQLSVIADGESVRYDRLVVRPDGAIRSIEIVASSLSDGRMLSVARDFTERKQAEDTLRLTEATNLALLNAMPDWVFRIGRDGRYLDFHGAANNSLLMPPEQFLGKTSHEVMPKEIADKTLEAIEKALADGNVVAFEYELEVGGAVRSFGCRITACGPDEVLAIVAEKGG